MVMKLLYLSYIFIYIYNLEAIDIFDKSDESAPTKPKVGATHIEFE